MDSSTASVDERGDHAEKMDLNQNHFDKHSRQPSVDDSDEPPSYPPPPPPTATEPIKFLGIEFAPLHIPLRRRLETFVVFFCVIEFILGYFCILFHGYVLFTSYWYLAVGYAAWLYLDRDTPRQGGRLFKWTRRLFFWKYFTSYFPMTLHKTADLDPKKNYIFGYHPHGIMASGAFGSFATEATGFSEKFPGITTHLTTLAINFWFPIHRDIQLGRGLVDSSKESINWLLQRAGKGTAVVIVVGGAAESLDAVPGTMRLTLKNRKGFIRLALQNGASVVPVVSFGENELFIQSAHPEDSWIRKFQHQMKALLKFTFPIFHGRGVFQYSMGLLPYRAPIHTIVGAPIPVAEVVPRPSQEQVDDLHAKYIQGLTELFNANKAKYATNPAIELVIQ